MKSKQWIMIAGLLGLFSVALGALASHSLQEQMSIKELAWVDTAVKYQMYHALALLGLACILLKVKSSIISNLCGMAFTLGTLCFSGSLYWLAFSGSKSLVYLTPIGGVLLMLGWIAIVFVAMRLDSSALK